MNIGRYFRFGRYWSRKCWHFEAFHSGLSHANGQSVGDKLVTRVERRQQSEETRVMESEKKTSLKKAICLPCVASVFLRNGTFSFLSSAAVH